MSNALILEFFDELSFSGDLPLFTRQVAKRYSEGTLQRLLSHEDVRTREAALMALRQLGSMISNAAIAGCLRDPDGNVQELAEGALWAIWFRADTPENCRELQRLAQLMSHKEYSRALTGLNALIARSPSYAEAYNQRAILYWRWGDYNKSITDCEQTLKLNPHHFGALAGLAQCHLHLKRPADALKVFKLANRVNPAMTGVEDNIHALEQMLREERKRKR